MRSQDECEGSPSEAEGPAGFSGVFVSMIRLMMIFSLICLTLHILAGCATPLDARTEDRSTMIAMSIRLDQHELADSRKFGRLEARVRALEAPAPKKP